MKFYIHAVPGYPPDVLSEQDVLLSDPRHRVVHEFEAPTVAEARMYYRGYQARWKEAPDFVQDVFDFHNLLDVARPSFLTAFPGAELISLRIKLIQEEWEDELYPALIQLRNLQSAHPVDHRHDEAIVGIADGIADAIYVLVGCAVSFGIPLKAVWQEVQRSNMAKAGPDGKPIKRPDGKVLKPDGWEPPNLYKVMNLVEPPPFPIRDDDSSAKSHDPRERPLLDILAEDGYPVEERTFILGGNAEERSRQLNALKRDGWRPFSPSRNLLGEDNGVPRSVPFRRSYGE